ncbi:UbiD family decarboxylase, partial [Bacteroidota bacterium]
MTTKPEYKVEYADLREWLEKVKEFGELHTIKGADWDKEMGGITEVLYREQVEKAPMLLFDDFPGYPSGYRCIIGILNSPKRLGLTVGLPTRKYEGKLDFLAAYRERMRHTSPIPHKMVKDGPVLENVQTGDEVDILKFPVPQLRAMDGGRFIGTACGVITRDPEEGWVNVGAYRVQVIDGKTVFNSMIRGAHGWIHRAKYLDQGKPCPMAIVVGADPLLWLVSAFRIPSGLSELDWVGGVRGEPFETVEGPFTGLPIPAKSEIVLEGEVLPGEIGQEGPFGEWMGYYGSMESRPRQIFHVKSVLHRNDPILTCAMPGKPPYDYLFQACVSRSAGLWEKLEQADVPDVKGAWSHEAGGARLFTVVSIKQRYHGHSRQAGVLASQLDPSSMQGRWVVVVDDDIDPTNMY